MTGRYCWTLAVMATLWAQTGARAQEAGPAATAPEEAQASPSLGVELGLRVGFQAGVGYIYKNAPSATGEPRDLKLTDAANGALPVMLEAGYRLSPQLSIGVYGQLAPVFLKTNEQSCPEGFDCSSMKWDFGAQALYHFSPEKGFDPWVGLGLGVEILHSEVSGSVQVPVPGGGTVPATTQVSVTDRGPELNVSAGGDFRLGQSLRVGPFLTVTLAQYTVRVGEQRVNITGVPEQVSQTPRVDNGMHALFALGARLAFLP